MAAVFRPARCREHGAGMTSIQLTPSTPVARPQWRVLARHYLEIVVAMFVAMGVLALARAAVGLTVSAHHHLGLAYLLMATDMSIGMATVMRWRGHGWRSTLEMCAVMYAPLLLLPFVWSGLLGRTGFMVIAHVAMFPLMLAVMLRRRAEYAHCH